MADPNKPSLDTAFSEFIERMVALLDFATAVAPTVSNAPHHVTSLTESVVVLGVTRFDEFFKTLVSLGARHREDELRKYLGKHGNDIEKNRAHQCDLPALVQIVRRRVSFENGAKRLDGIVREIFGFSVWPSDESRDIFLDLILVRNMIVHASGRDFRFLAQQAAYAPQFRRADVLNKREYGAEMAVYSLDYYKALLFFQQAVLVAVEQLKYLESKIVTDTSWTRRSSV